MDWSLFYPYILNMKTLSRVLLFVCGILLVVVLFVPMWRIELDAPQYPEGLMMQIYPNKLGGNVDIINGLNHYIGMKTLHEKDFVEFKILPGIIIFFSIACFGVAFLGRRKWVEWVFGVFVSFGIIAMVDFWRWEYEYGHDLNPDAAIRIPDMAYQPPLIGFKQLLNFGAYSVPDFGGWIFIAVGTCLLAIVIYERKTKYKGLEGVSSGIPKMLFLGMIILTSCSSVPDAIKIGRDDCQFCKMTISDSKFGAIYFTSKGKSYKFDDLKCLQDFIKSGQYIKNAKDQIWLVNYLSPYQLIELEKSFLLQGGNIKTPMNGNIAVFANKIDRSQMAQSLQANSIDRSVIAQ
ncbi:MAG: hypothetical protein B7Y15_14010 [Bacteroidetes bacterium 24-39-8]|nr:MAG: hypothetical protein B7Y15_14010 [Bacteroidetes bacterium 24-39-8]